jgi:hypothetical protein
MYYIRMQGRVTGPFEMDRLKALRARGVLQPFHEISSDRTTWNEAGTLPELFVNQSQSQGIVNQSFQPSQATAPTAPSWYYLNAQKERMGPVVQDAFGALISQGLFNKKTLVWMAGMPEWRTAEEMLPDLFRYYPSTGVNGSAEGSCSSLSWFLQIRAMILLAWPFYSSMFIFALLSSIVGAAAAAADNGALGPAAALGGAGFKVIVLGQFLFFIMQAIFAILIGYHIYVLGSQGGSLLKAAGLVEFSATGFLLLFYMIFTIIVLFGLFREIEYGTLRNVAIMMIAFHTLGQFLSALSTLLVDAGLANYAYSMNQWVWRHFASLAVIACLMSLITLNVGIVAIAVFADDGGNFLEKLQGMAYFAMAFYVSSILAKILEALHCLLMLPIASSFRNTVK